MIVIINFNLEEHLKQQVVKFTNCLQLASIPKTAAEERIRTKYNYSTYIQPLFYEPLPMRDINSHEHDPIELVLCLKGR
jgi:hypothetical protein